MILLVALALFVAQAINFSLLLRERNRLTLTGQTAPLAYRVVTALDQRADRSGVSGYRGFFYHFLGSTKGYRFSLSELSTIDTALLMAGVLFAQSWFDDPVDADEARIRDRSRNESIGRENEYGRG